MGSCNRCYCNVMAVVSTIAFILGILMFSAGISMLIAFGIHFVKPYHYSKHFQPTMCNITSVEVAGEVECSCSASCACDCTSSYPCMYLSVEYRLNDGSLKKGARLYENHETLEQQSETDCSLYVCHYDENNNRDDVITYRDTYGRIGKRFICFYNPKKLDEVIRVKTESITVIITMTIAFGNLLLGILMAVFTWKKC